MPKPAWEDLDAFLSLDDFAVNAIITLQSGATRTVRCIFDDPYLNAELGEYEMDSSRPRITCKESDVLDVRRGDTVNIDARIYDVLTSAQPDGTGMAMLEMALQG